MQRMKPAIAIRHVAFEDLGSFDAALSGHGYTITYLDAAVDDLATVERERPELLVVLGGSIRAYEGATHSVIQGEPELLGTRLGPGPPPLPVCLRRPLIGPALRA